MMIDLDKFKEINDTLGHDAGDEVLIKVAEILKNNSRSGDLSIRLGGDEFLLVLPLCSLQEAIDKAKSICVHINELSLKRSRTEVSASVGVSSTEQGLFIFKDLLTIADERAYKAKAMGGNNVQ